MTIGAMCTFLDITRKTWEEWRNTRADLSGVIGRVDQIIYTQKFEGAAADLLNANLISRELGLADKQEHTGKDGADLIPEHSPTETARRLAFLLALGMEKTDG